MAQIDSSIYFQQQAPDILGSVQRGLSMRDMIDQRQQRIKQEKELEGTKRAFSAGITQNPDGSTSMDRKKTLSELMKVNPARAFEAQQQFTQMDQAEQKAKQEKIRFEADTTASLVGGVLSLPPEQRPQAWAAARQRAQALGIDSSQVPEQYDEGIAKTLQGQALSVKDQLDQRWKEKEFGLKERETRIKESEARTKSAEAGTLAKNYVPGVGVALNEDDAKKLKEAKEMKLKFDRQINELISLRKDKGVEYFDRESVGRGKQLSKDLLLTYKNLAKLGVLSQADQDIVDKIIPADPLGQDWMPWQDSTLHRLVKFKGDLDADYENQLGTRLKSRDANVAGSNVKDYDSMSDEELLAEYKKLGGSVANSR